MADGNLSGEEKFTYAFNPEHMGMDFLGGAAMYGMSKAVPKVKEKLPWNKTGGGVEGGSGTPNSQGRTLLTGEDWNDYFREQYGYENVNWDTVFSSP